MSTWNMPPGFSTADIPGQDSLAYCDCCNAPMVASSHYGPDCSAGCETDACLLCAGAVPPTAEELLYEIEDLTPHAADPGVMARIEVLAKRAAVMRA